MLIMPYRYTGMVEDPKCVCVCAFACVEEGEGCIDDHWEQIIIIHSANRNVQ